MLPNLERKTVSRDSNLTDFKSGRPERNSLEQELSPKNTQLGTSFPLKAANRLRKTDSKFPQARYYANAQKRKSTTETLLNTQSSNENIYKLNKIFSEQNLNIRFEKEYMSRNVIIYTQLENTKDKFKKQAYPESLKEIDKKINKIRREIEYDRMKQHSTDENQNKHEEFEFMTGVGIQGQAKEDSKENQDEEEKNNMEENLKESNQEYDPKVDVKKALDIIQEKYQNQISNTFLQREQERRFRFQEYENQNYQQHQQKIQQQQRVNLILMSNIKCVFIIMNIMVVNLM